MLIKIVVILLLLMILYSLGSAFFYLAKDKGQGDRTVRQLSWRIGLSILLFLMLWIAYSAGWIEPNTGPMQRPTAAQPGE